MFPIIWVVLAAVTLHRVYIVIYNLFIHPLRKVPGPALYAISNLPKAWRNSVRGKHWHDLLELHEKYGDMVRVGPTEVSCVSPQSWNDIFGYKTGGRQVFGRDLRFMAIFQLGTNTFMSNEKGHHSFFRKLIGPGFSEKALVAQEPIIIKWADDFINSLLRRSNEPLDLVLTFHWATLDVMGDLTFGESFGCLENNRSSRWLELVISSQDFIGIFNFVLSFSITMLFYNLVVRLPITQRWVQSTNLVFDKAKDRLDRGARDRKDMLSLIWTDAQDEKLAVTKEQVLQVSTILCLAGMETTSTSLSGIVWWLLKSPHAYKRLVEEIRSIEKEEDLSLKKLASLPYLNCCISEGLRLHSPIAGAVQRVVPKAGDFVAGTFLPEGTLCGIPHWATGNVSRHWKEPSKFLPERWLGEEDSPFANETKDAAHFFSKGPMACIGKQLALTEMRLFLARLFWRFDVTLQPESEKWISDPDAVVRWLREKTPLMVKLIPRSGTNSEDFLEHIPLTSETPHSRPGEEVKMLQQPSKA